MRSQLIATVKRCVIKIGTSSVIKSSGELNLVFLEELASTIKDLSQRKIQVCVVTSGAVGAGKMTLGLKTRPKKLPDVQALAAVGQIGVMHAFKESFSKFGLTVGQILLTHEVLTNRSRYLNARYCMQSLFEMGCVPVINENDSVSIEELRVGDNDTLAAYVTNLIEADLLILLSDIDGLMTGDPKKNKNASLISEVKVINEEILAMAGPTRSDTGTGGLQTKLNAAKIVTQSGEAMIIANSQTERVFSRIMEGENIGTFFCPNRSSLQSKKRWLAFNTVTQGSIVIDDGAGKAIIENGKSLLPSGILQVEGQFQDKSLVCIVHEGKVIAKGIVNYNWQDVDKIKGLHSREIEKCLGDGLYEEVIHRDYLVVMKGEKSV